MALSPSARNSLFVFSGTLTSRILGFLRVILIGTTLGYTRLSDSYSLANETPNMMYELILGSLIASTMVPFFVQQYKRKDREADDALMSFVFVSSLVLVAIAMALAPLIAQFMTALNSSSSANAQKNLVVFFLLFFLPQIFFYAMTASMQSYLAARSRFITAAFAPIANNIVVIATLIYIRSRSAELDVPLSSIRTSSLIKILAVGTTTGVVIVALIVAGAYVNAGGRIKLVSLRNPAVPALIGRSKWMVGYAIANQIALFVIIAFANSFTGGVVMYLVAWSFFQLPHGLFANSIMTTMVPRITHTLEQKGDDPNDIVATQSTSTLTRQTATGLTIIMGVIAAIGISISIPSLVLLLAHGNISVDQAKHTGRVLIGFLAFLPAFSLYLFCVRLANSLNKTKNIFFINVLQNSLNVILALILKGAFSVVGLAVAFSLSYLLVTPLSIGVASKNLKSNLLEYKTTSIMISTCVIAAILGFTISSNLENSYIAVLGGAISCSFVLLVGAFFAKDDLKDLARLVYRRSPSSVSD